MIALKEGNWQDIKDEEKFVSEKILGTIDKIIEKLIKDSKAESISRIFLPIWQMYMQWVFIYLFVSSNRVDYLQ